MSKGMWKVVISHGCSKKNRLGFSVYETSVSAKELQTCTAQCSWTLLWLELQDSSLDLLGLSQSGFTQVWNIFRNTSGTPSSGPLSLTFMSAKFQVLSQFTELFNNRHIMDAFKIEREM